MRVYNNGTCSDGSPPTPTHTPTPNPSGSWTLKFWNNKDLSGNPAWQGTATPGNFINFNWGSNAPESGVSADNFSAGLEQNVYFPTSGEWKFTVRSDDGFRLYIDNQIVAQEWYDGWHDVGPTTYISAGNHQVKLEYFDGTGDAKLYLNWAPYTPPTSTPTPTRTPTRTPTATPNPSGSWTLKFWNNKDFSGNPVWQGIATPGNFINFNWGTSNPESGVNADNFSARLEQNVYFPSSGEWKFTIRTDDGFRLYIDNQIVAQEWYDGWHDVGPTRNLSAGNHQIKFEYFDGAGDAKLYLTWAPYTPPTLTPTPTRTPTHTATPTKTPTLHPTITTTPVPIFFAYSGFSADDNTSGDSNGNGDGIANCGEDIELFVRIQNQGSATATGINASISTSDPYVTWLFNTTSSYPDITAGSTAFNSNDFDFALAANTPNGHVIRFDLYITAANGGPKSTSFDVPVTCPQPAPAAPTNLNASDGAYTDKVHLTWAASSGATGYEVWRNTGNNSGAATRIASSVSGTSFDDTSASAGVTYYYWVKAKNTAGTSGFSSSDTGYRTSYGVIINEVELGNPNWVELFNAGRQAVNLTGWRLVAYSGDGTINQTFTLPAFTLQPGAYVVLHEIAGTNSATNLYFNAGITTWTNGGSGAAVLTTPGGAEVDFVQWGSAAVSSPSALAWTGANPAGPPAGKTLGRVSTTDTDSSSDWASQSPSPGAQNEGIGSRVYIPIIIRNR